MRKILILSLVLFSALSFGQGAMMGSVGASGGVDPGFDSGMLTDGDFSSGSTYWTAGTSWSIADGNASFDYVAAGNLTQTDGDMATSIATATWYTLSFTISDAASSARFLIRSTSGETYEALATYANGERTADFLTPADIGDGGIEIRAYNTSAGSFSITNLNLSLL